MNIFRIEKRQGFIDQNSYDAAGSNAFDNARVIYSVWGKVAVNVTKKCAMVYDSLTIDGAKVMSSSTYVCKDKEQPAVVTDAEKAAELAKQAKVSTQE